MKMAPYFPPLVVAGCSGAGKGTLIAKLMAWDPDAFGFSVSHTTRQPRPGEEDGVHYHFAEVDTMKKEIEQGLFLGRPPSTATIMGPRSRVSRTCRRPARFVSWTSTSRACGA